VKSSKLVHEFLGTAILLIAITGSSYMAAELTSDLALALLINAVVTGATLAVLIKSSVEQSGAHFNPAVSLAALITKRIDKNDFLRYLAAQFSGAILGVGIANTMFHDSSFVTSGIERSGGPQLLGEVIATSGLIYLALKSSRKTVWKLIPLWIFAAYFFTVSTSFANPAVTVARSFTAAPAGISPNSISWFVITQVGVAIVVALVFKTGIKKAKYT
jgi:glycerol uptake facilitator-like aquaporin